MAGSRSYLTHNTINTKSPERYLLIGVIFQASKDTRSKDTREWYTAMRYLLSERYERDLEMLGLPYQLPSGVCNCCVDLARRMMEQHLKFLEFQREFTLFLAIAELMPNTIDELDVFIEETKAALRQIKRELNKFQYSWENLNNG